MKKYLNIKNIIKKVSYVGTSFLVSSLSFASNVSIIPLSSSQQATLKNQGLDSSILGLLQNSILPIVEIALGLGILWMAGSGMLRAFKEYTKDRDFGSLKESGFAVAYVVLIGGGVTYMLDMLRTTSFTA